MGLKKIMMVIALLIPIRASAQGVVIPATATTTLAKDYVRVSWHVSQYIHVTCEDTAPRIDPWTGKMTIPMPTLALSCFKKIESDEERLFANREEADAFVNTKPSDNGRGIYNAEITNLKIDEIHP